MGDFERTFSHDGSDDSQVISIDCDRNNQFLDDESFDLINNVRFECILVDRISEQRVELIKKAAIGIDELLLCIGFLVGTEGDKDVVDC